MGPGGQGNTPAPPRPVFTGQMPKNGTILAEIVTGRPKGDRANGQLMGPKAALVGAVLSLIILFTWGCSFQERLASITGKSGALSNTERQSPAAEPVVPAAPTTQSQHTGSVAVAPAPVDRSPTLAQPSQPVATRAATPEVSSSTDARPAPATETKGAEMLLHASVAPATTQHEPPRASEPRPTPDRSATAVSKAAGASAATAGKAPKGEPWHAALPRRDIADAWTGWSWALIPLVISITAGVVAVWSFRRIQAADIRAYERSRFIESCRSAPATEISAKVLASGETAPGK